jgi:uncharacterized protein YxjI
MSVYQMREKLFAIGDDYWIEDDTGEKVFKVNGKAVRVRETLILEDCGGNELLKIQERKLRLHGTMVLERDGDTVATVRKALISPLRHRFEIELEAGGELKAHGHILDHEFEVERDGDEVARVSKGWFRVRDTYGIEISPGEDEALLLALTVALGEMTNR